MASNNYTGLRNGTRVYKPTNVVDLIKKAKDAEKKEKKKTLIVAAAAVSALAISGLIISL